MRVASRVNKKIGGGSYVASRLYPTTEMEGGDRKAVYSFAGLPRGEERIFVSSFVFAMNDPDPDPSRILDSLLGLNSVGEKTLNLWDGDRNFSGDRSFSFEGEVGVSPELTDFILSDPFWKKAV